MAQRSQTTAPVRAVTDIVERERDAAGDADTTRPAHEADRTREARDHADTSRSERANRDPDERDDTDGRPTEQAGRESEDTEGRR